MSEERRMEYFRDREPSPAVLARFKAHPVIIWSGEHGVWWRADRCGYTTNPAEAGRYTFEEAYAATHHCGREKRIFFQWVKS